MVLEAGLKALGFKEWQLTEYVDGSQGWSGDSFPAIKVWFGCQESPPGYVTPVGLFDARTRQSLSGGYDFENMLDPMKFFSRFV